MGFSERRDSILDSALELVAGLDTFSLSMAQVAEHEGVSKPVVYDHFANIDELLTELFRRERTQAVAEMLAIVGSRADTDDPQERVVFAVSLAQQFFGRIHERPERWRVTFEPSLGMTPVTREFTEAGKREVHEAMVELIAWAVPNAAALNLGLTAHAVQAMIERMVHLIATQPDAYTADEMLAFALEHVGWWMAGRAALQPADVAAVPSGAETQRPS